MPLSSSSSSRKAFRFALSSVVLSYSSRGRAAGADGVFFKNNNTKRFLSFFSTSSSLKDDDSFDDDLKTKKTTKKKERLMGLENNNDKNNKNAQSVKVRRFPGPLVQTPQETKAPRVSRSGDFRGLHRDTPSETTTTTT